MLKMAKIEAIHDLHSRGCSMTKIAETVGVDRKTVKKYLEKEDFNRTVEDEAKAERKSKLDPYKPLIRELLEQQAEGKLFRKQRWTAKRMHEYLWKDLGHAELEKSYLTVLRYMKQLRAERAQGYAGKGTLPLEWHPGEAQADFGEADFVAKDGSLRRLKYFVLVFPYSNRLLCALMPGENCECVCQSLQYVFSFLGGVPWRIVFDNATGIGQRLGQEMRESTEFTRFRLHYGFIATYTNPCSGWEKGSVENGVKCVREHLFVPPMMIADDLDAFNREVMLPLSFSFRAAEPHYRKGRTVGELFEDDREALKDLNPRPFTLGRIDRRGLNQKGGFRIDGDHWYYVGPQGAGAQVLVHRTDWEVRVHDTKGKLLKSFERVYGPGRTERYDLEAMLRGLSVKAGGWANSVVREEMEDGPLKSYLDSCEGKEDLRAGLRLVSDAAKRFGLAETCYAMDRLLPRGHLPTADDIGVYCRRMMEFPPDASENATGVDLLIYDACMPGACKAAGAL